MSKRIVRPIVGGEAGGMSLVLTVMEHSPLGPLLPRPWVTDMDRGGVIDGDGVVWLAREEGVGVCRVEQLPCECHGAEVTWFCDGIELSRKVTRTGTM
ncbi:hypothetical protein ACIRRH_00540 [Kitasatospora sp. NPDC101235]|uniref:hypothetical protein n=1 Tax=Kitasatospora sp. NPDC101235 TaxID=3364101 RepID=UPI00382E1B4E